MRPSQRGKKGGGGGKNLINPRMKGNCPQKRGVRLSSRTVRLREKEEIVCAIMADPKGRTLARLPAACTCFEGEGKSPRQIAQRKKIGKEKKDLSIAFEETARREQEKKEKRTDHHLSRCFSEGRPFRGRRGKFPRTTLALAAGGGKKAASGCPSSRGREQGVEKKKEKRAKFPPLPSEGKGGKRGTAASTLGTLGKKVQTNRGSIVIVYWEKRKKGR